MIPARHHPLIDRLFNWYLHNILKKDFYGIEVIGQWPDNLAGNLVIGNHVSWWDGFWAYYLNKRFLKKRLYVMMLEEQLKPRRFLTRIGGFSINPGNKSVIESIDYAAEKLKQSGNLVVMYPQGRIASFSAGVLQFQKGVEKVVKKSGIQQILFYTALTDYFSQRKPTLTFYLGVHTLNDASTQSIEQAYRLFYQNAVEQQAGRLS